MGDDRKCDGEELNSTTCAGLQIFMLWELVDVRAFVLFVLETAADKVLKKSIVKQKVLVVSFVGSLCPK